MLMCSFFLSRGKKFRIKDATEGKMVLGRRAWQNREGSFRYTMNEFAAGHRAPIDVTRGQLTTTKTVDEQTPRRVGGGL